MKKRGAIGSEGTSRPKQDSVGRTSDIARTRRLPPPENEKKTRLSISRIPRVLKLQSPESKRTQDNTQITSRDRNKTLLRDRMTSSNGQHSSSASKPLNSNWELLGSHLHDGRSESGLWTQLSSSSRHRIVTLSSSLPTFNAVLRRPTVGGRLLQLLGKTPVDRVLP